MNAKQNPELYYLVNPIYSSKLHKKEEIKPKINNVPKKRDKIFYKKRIQQLTKQCMQNNPPNSIIQDTFNEYLVSCISYFKEEDTSEIIQQEYKDLIFCDENVEHDDIDMEAIDKELYIKKNTNKIEDCIPINKTLLNEKIDVDYPKQKILDIKDSKFKVKGIKKNENI